LYSFKIESNNSQTAVFASLEETTSLVERRFSSTCGTMIIEGFFSCSSLLATFAAAF